MAEVSDGAIVENVKERFFEKPSEDTIEGEVKATVELGIVDGIVEVVIEKLELITRLSVEDVWELLIMIPVLLID
jgi:hypothetical protein